MIMIAHAFIKVFKDWRYVLLAASIALFVFAFAVWFPNLRLLFSILTNPLVPLPDKLMLPVRLLNAITTNFTVLAASYTIAIALLVGVNSALTVYQVRRARRLSHAGAAVGSLGIVSGIFGLGCAACNSLVLMSVLGLLGGAGIIPLLPLKGGEFGIIGVLLLCVATYFTAKQITKPLVC